MYVHELENGDQCSLLGRTLKFIARGPRGMYSFEDKRNPTENLYFSEEQLISYLEQGKLKFLEQAKNPRTETTSYEFDITALTDQEQRQIRMRAFYMQRLSIHYATGGSLSTAPLRTFSEQTHRAYVAHCKEQDIEPITKVMSPSALRRWFRRWHDSGRKPSCLVQDARGNRLSKLSADQQHCLNAIIDQAYLTKSRRSAIDVHALLAAEIDRLNRQAGMGDNKTITPSYKTLLNWIRKRTRKEILTARFNAEYAHRMTREYRATPEPSRHLERVQVDHTQVDVYVDMGQAFLIRPWLTLIIDVYSRAVLGYWLTPNPPSADSVLHALRMACMPKDIAKLGGDPTWQWPMFGIPLELVMDNGKEFWGNDLETAAAELSIIQTFTPPRQPFFKAQIERFFGTINSAVLAQLPSQVHKEEPEKISLDHPHLTIESFNRILLQWITTMKHHMPNAEGYTPSELWLRSVKEHGSCEPHLPDQTVKLALSKVADDKTIQSNGIHFNNLIFNNQEITRLRNALIDKTRAKNPRVTIKWSARDVGRIWVLDPTIHMYIECEARDKSAHGVSLYAHRVIRREIRNRTKARLNNSSYHEAKLALEAVINEATSGKKSKPSKRVNRFRDGINSGKNESYVTKLTNEPMAIENEEEMRDTNKKQNRKVNRKKSTEDQAIDMVLDTIDLGRDLRF